MLSWGTFPSLLSQDSDPLRFSRWNVCFPPHMSQEELDQVETIMADTPVTGPKPSDAEDGLQQDEGKARNTIRTHFLVDRFAVLEFWLCLPESERRSLIARDKELALRKLTKYYEDEGCRCTDCVPKRSTGPYLHVLGLTRSRCYQVHHPIRGSFSIREVCKRD